MVTWDAKSWVNIIKQHHQWGDVRALERAKPFIEPEVMSLLLRHYLDTNKQLSQVQQWRLDFFNDGEFLNDLQIMLELGADINFTESRWPKNTLLHYVCNQITTKPSTILKLMELKANINLQNRNKASPLHLACNIGNSDVVRFLIEQGANVTAVDTHGRTALMRAVQGKHVSVVQKFADLGIQFENDTVDFYGRTTHHIAKRFDFQHVLEAVMPTQSI